MIGTVGIPTIAIILLFALPFVDVRRERRLLRRPVALVALVLTVISMGVLTYKGATAPEPAGGESEVLCTGVGRGAGLRRQRGTRWPAPSCSRSRAASPCHVYSGEGASNLGAPELTAIGASGGRDAEAFAQYVADPSKFGNNVMPKFGIDAGGSLTAEQLTQLGEFLAASKGGG